MYSRNSNSFIERYPIANYFVATFIVTMFLGAGYQFTNNPFISPQYAPTIALIIICALTKNWSVCKKIFNNPFKESINLLWVSVSLLLPILIILISTLIMSIMGTGFTPWQDTTSMYLITIITTILGCIFEEIGWRGYLLPKFAEKHNMFKSSLGLGLLWGSWHFKFAYGIIGFILFVMVMICFSIIMTWIYMKTKGNLLYMILFHFGVNIGTVTLLQNREGILFYTIAIIISILICIPIVLNNKNEFFNKSINKAM